MCCLLSESLLFSTLKIEIFVFSLSNLLNKNLPGSFLSWKHKIRFFSPWIPDVFRLYFLRWDPWSLWLFANLIYVYLLLAQWSTRNGGLQRIVSPILGMIWYPTSDWQCWQFEINSSYDQRYVKHKNNMFSLGTELKASCWAVAVFFVDLTILVGRVIWLQLFQVTFFKRKKPFVTSKSQMKRRRLKTKDRLGQVEIFVFSVFFLPPSCHAMLVERTIATIGVYNDSATAVFG